MSLTSNRSSSRTANLIISSGNGMKVDPSRGSFTLRFPSSYQSSDEMIGLLNLSIYYSWNNLTAPFNNITGCSYIWTNSAGSTTYPVSFPEGFYSIAQLNDYLQFTMKNNGHYLVDASGTPVYYLGFVVNTTYYGITLTATPFPSTLPAGFTNPSGTVLGSNTTPQMVVSNSTNWGKLIGFTGGSYPPTASATPMYYNSSIVPVISPITQVLVLCDWVNDNRFSQYNSVIGSFIPSEGFGQLINFTPPVLTSYDVASRQYDSIEVRLVDQNYSPLDIKDYAQASITLLVQKR